MAQYNLSSSMSDRINFDDAMRIYFDECLRGYADSLRVRDAGRLFKHYYQPGQVDADDPAEARARARAQFDDALQREIERRAEDN